MCFLRLSRRLPLGPVQDSELDEAGLDTPARLALGLSLSAFTLLLIPSLMGPVKVVSDGPIYHLYFAVQWWKAGALKLVPVPFGESAATYFPANGDFWFTWLIVGWGGDRLARIGQVPFLILAALRRLYARQTAGCEKLGRGGRQLLVRDLHAADAF